MVLFMGVLTKDKGAAHVVEAMRVLWDAGVEATLVMVGQPVDEFERYWRRLPARVTQRIVRTGIVSEQAKRDALAAADLFVLPSRVDSFGIVFLEAWANRLPVIGARAGGIPGVVDEGEDGLLAAYGDVQSIAASIKRLLDDAALRLALGANGERKVAQRYTWDWIFQRLNHIYGGLLNARPVSHSRISP
jgi:glycosyltransferase involved in cell wall biosynthesis